jgi:hypothetical protein
MEQAVDAAEIDEGAVVGDVLHHAVVDLAFLEVLDQLGARFGPGFLQHRAARNDDIAALAIHLEDLEGLGGAHEGRDVAHGADIDLAARQEGHGAREIDGEAAFDAAEDMAGHALVVLVCLFQHGPGFLPACLLATQHRFAFAAFDAVDEDIDDIADLDFRVAVGAQELLHRDATLGLEADIDEHLFVLVVDAQDRTFHHGAFEGLRIGEGFFEKGGEIVTAGIRIGLGFSHVAHGPRLSFQLFYSGQPVVSGGLAATVKHKPDSSIGVPRTRSDRIR